MRAKLLPALAAACMLLLSGCSQQTVPVFSNTSAQKTPLSFSWWGNDLHNQHMIEGVISFGNKYPELKLSIQYRSEESFLDLLKMQENANTGSDVIQLRYDWLHMFDAETSFYPLSELKQYLNLHLLDSSILEWGKLNGELYALPDGLNFPVVYFNQELLQKYDADIPATWDDLFALAQKTAADGLPVLGMEPSQLWMLVNAHLKQTTGHTLLDDAGRICCTKEELTVMLDFCQSLLARNVVSLVPEAAIALSDQTACGILAWASYAETIATLGETALSHVTIGTLPVCRRGDPADGWYYKPTVLYAIDRDTLHPQEAARLLSYFLNNSTIIHLQGLSNGYPSSQTVYSLLQSDGRMTGLVWDACSSFETNQEALTLINPYLERPELLQAFRSAAVGAMTVDDLLADFSY